MSNNWWANKLGTQQPQNTPQVQQPTYVPAPEAPRLPATQQARPESPRCPSCGSGNYGGTAETRARCYDCGYPIQQSGSGVPGMRGPQSQGPVQAAKQVHSGNNFNPQGIIGKI
jgi:hypothetical protein